MAVPAHQWIAKDVMTIADFFSAEECDQSIALSESIGFEDAPITTSLGMIMMKDVRNNDRVMLDDKDRAAALWQRLQDSMPPKFRKKWRPVGLNERLRFYRYDIGQQFDWHKDGYFERDNGERSFFTFMIYLNDDFDGGGTSFVDDDYATTARFQVIPKKGMALLFHHPISHKGEPVQRGRKYVLRTDVMYARLLSVV
jgi:predicted 2-oxoglutarate/Fe(II)-dependent dioxygenase YbiX